MAEAHRRFQPRAAVSLSQPLDNVIFREASQQDVYALYYLKGTDPDRPLHFPVRLSDDGMPAFLTMRDMLQTQLFYRHKPYLGFVPLEDVFEGPIFGRFHGSRSYLETQVKKIGLQFQFDPFLAYSWQRVEKALVRLVADFHPRSRPLTVKPDPFPSDTKFFEPRNTIQEVVNSVLFAQKLIVRLAVLFL